MKKGAKPPPILAVLADTPSLPKSVFERLPRPIRRALPVFTQQAERDVFATASLGVLSGCLPGVWGRYDTGLFAPHLFCCITAPAASGKGVLNHARKLGEEVEALFMEEYLEKKKAHKESRETGAENAADVWDVDLTVPGEGEVTTEPDLFGPPGPSPADGSPQENGASPEAVKEPGKKRLLFDADPADISDTPPWKKAGKKGSGGKGRSGSGSSGGEGDEEEAVLRRLFLSGDISSSALILFMDENGGGHGGGFGVVFETEIDTVVKTQKQEWGGTSDTLRKAHAHETVSYLRVEAKARIVTSPTLAVVLAGTPKQVLRLIPSPEDGLFSRFLFYGFLPDDPLSWKDVRPRDDVPDPADVLKEGAREVRRLWAILEGRGKANRLRVLLRPHQWDLLNERMGAVKEKLFARFDYAGSSTAHRTGLHVFRLAMTLAVWRAFEAGVDLASAATVTVEDEEFDAALSLGLTYARHAAAIMRALPREEATLDMTEEEARLYRALPEEFGRAEALAAGEGAGISERTTDRRLRTWAKTGQLRKVRKGVYRKVDRHQPERPQTGSPPNPENDGENRGEEREQNEPPNPAETFFENEAQKPEENEREEQAHTLRNAA